MSSPIAEAASPPVASRLQLWSVCHSLLAWLIALNIADLFTTKAVLDRGGRESNPIMQPLVDELWQAATVKGLCLAVVCILVLRCQHLRRVSVALGVVNLWYVGVVGWNLVTLARA